VAINDLSDIDTGGKA